jgi:hypothetical protein
MSIPLAFQMAALEEARLLFPKDLNDKILRVLLRTLALSPDLFGALLLLRRVIPSNERQRYHGRRHLGNKAFKTSRIVNKSSDMLLSMDLLSCSGLSSLGYLLSIYTIIFAILMLDGLGFYG